MQFPALVSSFQIIDVWHVPNTKNKRASYITHNILIFLGIKEPLLAKRSTDEGTC